ncbi:MAG: PEP-CTERM sorting domain-containing protein [Phycisphaerae bacterium]
MRALNACLAVAVLAVWIPVAPAPGQDLYWAAAVDGNAWQAGNWNPPEVPDANDRLHFDHAATYTVQFNGDVPESYRMTFHDGTVKLRLLEAHKTGYIPVGLTAPENAEMQILEGRLDAGSLYIGCRGSTGRMEVVGNTSSYRQEPNSEADLLMGAWGGDGTLWIRDGAEVVISDDAYLGGDSGGSGTVELSGASSLIGLGGAITNRFWIGSESAATGTLTVREYSQVEGDYFYLGREPGTRGEVTVESYGTLRVRQDLSIGSMGGTGVFTLGLWGEAHVAGTTYLGRESGEGGTLTLGGNFFTGSLDVGATGVVDFRGWGLVIDGGTWTDARTTVTIPFGSMTLRSGASGDVAAGGLVVGGATSAAGLTVRDGSVLSTGPAVVGLHDCSGATGAEVIGEGADGAGSSWAITGDLCVGQGGTGMLMVAQGGGVSVGGDLLLADGGSFASTVRVEGLRGDGNSSMLNVGNDLCVGLAGGKGEVHVEDGGQVSVGGSVYLGREGADANATLTVTGTGWDGDRHVPSRLGAGGRIFVASYEGTAGAMKVAGGGVVEAHGMWVGGGTGRVEVSRGGVLLLAEELRISETGSVILEGGAITAGRLEGPNLRGLEFRSGTLTVGGDLDVSRLDPWLTLHADRSLTVGGATTIGPGASLVLDGGSLSIARLVNRGSFEFRSGWMALTGSDLVIGADGVLGEDVWLHPARRLSVSGETTVQPRAWLTVDATAFGTGSLVNGGEVVLTGSNAQIATALVTNTGLVRGSGRVVGELTNDAGGEVAVGPGQEILITGPVTNNGGLMTLAGGTLWAKATLANAAEGLVMGNGLLRADGGIYNAATIAFSGVANVIGDTTNTPDGFILVTGVGPTTFFEDVHNDGEIRVSAGSTAVYLGAVDGDGNWTGGGTNYLEGDLKPGSSAAIMSFEGHVAFGSLASLQIELADPDNSDPLAPRYDALDVVADVELAGTLELDWLPIPGDPNSKFGGVYSILSWGGARAGVFDGIDCQMEAYLDTSVFEDGIEYDDANGEVKIHLYDLLDGDADLDGRVARDDFHALQAGFASPEPDWFTGDFNFDGRVDFLDYLTWKANVGDAVPGGEKVPEPATASLLLLGAVLALCRKRRRPCLPKRAAPTINDPTGG